MASNVIAIMSTVDGLVSISTNADLSLVKYAILQVEIL